MILFKKPLVCYISSNFLEVLEPNTHNQNRLSFSAESIQHAEIVNEKKFKEELQKFISGLSLKKGKGIIILSEELVYISDINAGYKNEEDETSKFLTAIPLVKSNIATISLHSKNKIQILAANRKLYESVWEVLKMNEIEIFSIVPLSVFDFRINSQELTPQDASRIAGANKKLQGYNFLQSKDNSAEENEIDKKKDDEKESSEEETEKKSMLKQYIYLAISIIILASAIGYLLLGNKIITNPFLKTPEVQLPKSTNVKAPSVSSQPSPTVNPLTVKESIKIEILNGSGIEGQAGKISNLLQGVGYSNVITGNTDNLEQRTTIIFNKLLPKNVISDITDAIKNDFPDPTLQEASQAAQYDLVITTGKY